MQITETFLVKNPELWWPVGLGSPHLYKLHAKLAHVGSEAGQLKVIFFLRVYVCFCF